MRFLVILIALRVILLTHVLVVHHHPPRSVSRITGSSVSSVSPGTTTAIVATDIVTIIIIILMYCIVSNQKGVLSPNEIIAFCMWTDSECMHIPTEGPLHLSCSAALQ